MPASLTDKKSNIISRTVAANVALLNAQAEVLRVQQEGIDSGLTSGANVFTDADFVGANSHMTAAQFLAAFAVYNAIESLLAANSRAHYKTLQTLHP